MPPPINLCKSYDSMCTTLLNLSGCPLIHQNKTACTDENDYSTFVGNCACGEFDPGSVRVGELLIDGQVKGNVTNSFLSIWPLINIDSIDPSLTIDACLSYENACDHWYNRIACPGDLR
jgi:hypothetical protein